MPNEETHNLCITCKKPYLHIDLTQTYGRIYVGDSSLDSEGLASRIEKILVHGKIWYPSLPKNNWVSFLFGIPFTLGWILQNTALVIIGILIPLFAFLWALLHYVYATQRYNTVIFKFRKEATDFWERNKDDLIKLIVGAIIGVIIAKIFDVLLK